MKLIKKLIHRALGIEVVSALRQPQADREHAVRTVKPKDGSTFLAQHPSLWDDVLAMADRCIKAVRKLWTIPTPKQPSQEEMAAVFARHTQTAAQVGYDLMKQGIRERLRKDQDAWVRQTLLGSDNPEVAALGVRSDVQEHLDLSRRREELLGEMSMDADKLRESLTQAEVYRMIHGTYQLTSDQMERLLIGIKECKSRARANQLWDRALATYVPEHTDPKLKEIMQEVADVRLRQFAAEDAAAAQAKKPVIRWCPVLQQWRAAGLPYVAACCAIKLNLLNQKGKR
ncbi:hypothetical protein RG2014_012 [Delftia phage RG-2014]|uniref:Uncharacterized protein n=1 Tax=Delftia phage RG-2014 TaxID=1563661 RepID=A0A097PBC9_9CAUD|nr:hypothetical protein RG2014_012 [Delftia phage RG-2014]AIU44266.1 hypothetical protein RG2014_012 [Delftia phage RG-2014]